MRGFGDLEGAIMELLWSATRPMSVREVRESLSGQREYAYTTVMTVMDNLHTKQWLTRHQEGRAYLYRPVASREAYVAELMREALRDSDDRSAAFMHFVTAITPEDAQSLRAALRKVPKEPRSSDG